MQRQHGLGGVSLDEDERGERHDGDREQAEHQRGIPVVGDSAEIGHENDGAQRRREESGSGIVDPVPLTSSGVRQCPGNHGERDDAKRQVDEEDPAPRPVGSEVAAEQRAGDAGDTEDGAEDPLIAAALPRRDDIADDRHRRHHQAAAAESLDDAEDDQLHHRLAQAAENGADEEQDHGALEDPFPSVQIAKLAVERGHDRLGEQVGGNHPREPFEPSQLTDDGRQRRRDDRLIEGGKQHREQQPAEDDENLLVGQS
jgi:hypothetical protein